jgi:hypothetical protein
LRLAIATLPATTAIRIEDVSKPKTQDGVLVGHIVPTFFLEDGDPDDTPGYLATLHESENTLQPYSGAISLSS